MSDARFQQIKDNLAAIDAATTKCSAAVVSIGARIDDLLQKLTDAPTSDEVQALVDAAKLEVDKLQPVADSLAAMGASQTNPIPTPVPEPEPPPVG